MKVSTRNQFKGKVTSLTNGIVNSEVVIELAGGTQIVSTITLGAVANLELKKGSEVIALIKASNVMIGTGITHISARNVIQGKIVSLVEGAVNTEVSVKTGECVITAIITKLSAASMELKIDKDVCAIIKASSVMIACE